MGNARTAREEENDEAALMLKRRHRITLQIAVMVADVLLAASCWLPVLNSPQEPLWWIWNIAWFYLWHRGGGAIAWNWGLIRYMFRKEETE